MTLKVELALAARQLQTKSLKSSSCLKWFYLQLLLLLVFSATTAFSGSIVKYLPGYDGELPFKLETGLVYRFFYVFLIIS